MPRYFFHAFNGRTQLDAEGTELPNLRAARIEAAQRAGDILKHEAEALWSHGDWKLQVTDDHGLILFTIDVLVTEAPAIREERKSA